MRPASKSVASAVRNTGSNAPKPAPSLPPPPPPPQPPRQQPLRYIHRVSTTFTAFQRFNLQSHVPPTTSHQTPSPQGRQIPQPARFAPGQYRHGLRQEKHGSTY